MTCRHKKRKAGEKKTKAKPSISIAYSMSGHGWRKKAWQAWHSSLLLLKNPKNEEEEVYQHGEEALQNVRSPPREALSS